ncbi:MAG: lariocidin/triculamin family lasso peptide core domain [Micromonosporaceae bacterium]
MPLWTPWPVRLGRCELSTKSTPGDGQHGRGVKGGLSDADHRGPIVFLRDLVRGLLQLRRW